MSDKVIRINRLSGGYDDNQILKDITLSVEKGGFTAIAGPNGSGKSTLLKYLIHELKSPNGTITLFEDDINSLKQKQIAKLISFQGQYARRDEDFTVREIVELGRYAHSDAATSSSIVEKALSDAGISHLADKLVTEISGGEFQLVMLARTICQDSRVMALDEPINNLDPNHQHALLRQLKNLVSDGKTVLCVLHDLNAILRFSDRCILLKDGKVFAYGDTASVLTVENIREVYSIDSQIIEKDGRSFIIFD